MQQLSTHLTGPRLFRPTVHRDDRGFLIESYRCDYFSQLGINDDFVQDNHSRSSKGVVRGMHFQVGSRQAKLIRCVRGAIVDVVVDIRSSSPTYREWEQFELSEDNHLILYCPSGFAHGFCAISCVADVFYKCSAYYDPESELSFAVDDPDIGIEWPSLKRISSLRDARAPRLRDLESLLEEAEW